MNEIESVWDYPRPPRIESNGESIRGLHTGIIFLETNQSLRILETSHPPAYYLPRDAFINCELRETSGTSFCEFKGAATYYDLVIGDVVVPRFGWQYPNPTKNFTSISETISFYPGLVDEVLVNDEKVLPQEGNFYGGWITSRVKGPFKGAPGTLGW